MDKREIERLHEELNELSALEEQNLDRMVEIAKILNAYYMGGNNVKGAEKKSAEDDQRNTA